jgi:hypothetical protein
MVLPGVAQMTPQITPRLSMAILRFLAGVFLLIAVIALAFDATRQGGFVVTSLYDSWRNVAPQSVAAAQSALSRSSHPLVWEYGVKSLLAMPAWGLFGTIGLLLAYAGRRRKRVNVFAN